MKPRVSYVLFPFTVIPLEATMLPHKEIHVEQKNDDVPAVNAHAFLHISWNSW